MDKTRITNANKQHARRSAGAGDFWKGEQMEELIKRLERVIQTGAPNKDGMHPISAEVVLEVVKQLPPAQPGPSQVAKDIARIVENGQDMRVIAQPERIKGHWIEHDDGLVACECSVCHEKYNLYEEDVFGRNFCPNCGAEMEVTT